VFLESLFQRFTFCWPSWIKINILFWESCR